MANPDVGADVPADHTDGLTISESPLVPDDILATNAPDLSAELDSHVLVGYRQILERLPAAVYTCDAAGRLILFNDAAVRLWGRTPVVGTDLWCGSYKIFRPDGTPLPLDQCPMARTLREGRAHAGEEILIERPNGDRRVVIAHPEPIRNTSGVMVGAVNMLVDITPRKQAEAELAAAKESLTAQVRALTRLHALSLHLAGSPDLESSLRAVLHTLVQLHDADYGLLSLYDPHSSMLHAAASIGFDGPGLDRMGTITPQADGDACSASFFTRERTIVEDIDAEPRFEWYRQTARAVGVRAVHSTPVLTRRGDILGVLSVYFERPRRPTEAEQQFADICARNAADVIETIRSQQALRESEARFRHMADQAPVLIWLNDRQGCEFVNREYLRFFGCTLEQAQGTGWRQFLHPEDAETYLGAFLEAARERRSFDAQFRARRSDGTYRWLRSMGAPRFADDGAFLGYVGCSIDISEIKASEGLLRQADRRKDEFLATLAHELRNPLAPIRNSLHSLRLEAVDPRCDGIFALMERQVDHMVRLVDDLMEVSRITRGKIELRRQGVALETLVLEAVETSRPLIDAAGHQLLVEMPADPLMLNADTVRLVQVFANVLNNAAKYTGAGGRITIAARRHGDEVVVSVRDTGQGIAPEALPKIFDLFVQGGDAGLRDQGGLGIGLTLVRRLVEMHGGRVEARSAGRGQGSEFLVTLPLSDEPRPTSAPTETADSRLALDQRRVLIVDDNRDGADSLSLMLQYLGAMTRVAYDGKAALAEFVAFRPHAVLLDIGLPGMSGYEVARKIRQQAAIDDVLLVALTGWGQEEDRRRSADAGFDHHMVKPLEPQRLKDVLHTARIRNTQRSATT
jgi:PAS domain S-box-containing protein